MIFKKLLFLILFNSTLFFILVISIQNSSNKHKVNLLTNETVSLPLSFIMGISFICGSLTGNIPTFNLTKNKESNLDSN